MNLIRNLYLHSRFYRMVVVIICLFIASYFVSPLFAVSSILFYSLILLTLLDIIVLFRNRRGVHGARFTPDKLSNGDENELRIYLENFYPFRIDMKVMDEIPHQFQKRDMAMELTLNSKEKRVLSYSLRPTKRGEYNFGAVNAYITSPFKLAARRYRFSEGKIVPVYPSYIQMRKYELMAISNNLTELGIKKIRKIGHNMEFEQIKDYVAGDDFRTINWKATARRSQLMVNNYQDEKSQQVYSLIDKGRVMQMPFGGLSLLDYAINASLVISNIAIKKEDKAGLVTFQHKISSVIPATKRNNQMFLIQEALYKQKTAYRESDFSRLYSLVRTKIRQRSLLLLYTNFESRVSLERQIPFLASMARNHLLVIIFFENTEMSSLLTGKARTLRNIYHKGIAEKFAFEKKLIVKELASYGIHSILTPPEQLTVNTINKYLELKARGLI